jgi:hypothetical protein
MQVAPLTFESVAYIAENMREWDKREIYATRWTEDPLELAHDAMVVPDFAQVAGLNGRPIAAFGAIPLHPHVWNIWMFATPEFDKIGISLTKFVRRSMMPALADTGAHRAQCLSMAGHDQAQAWLEFLGATRESTLAEYGRNREDFYRYVWRP